MRNNPATSSTSLLGQQTFAVLTEGTRHRRLFSRLATYTGTPQSSQFTRIPQGPYFLKFSKKVYFVSQIGFRQTSKKIHLRKLSSKSLLSMPTSRAERLDKLFERDSLPPPPDPNTSHIADTEIISKMQPAQQPWKVPAVAQTPRKITQSPPRVGRDLEQFTSSDDDEYVRAFKQTPSIKPETTSKGMKKTSIPSGYQRGERPKARNRSEATSEAAVKIKADRELDDGVSTVDRDGHPLIGRFCLFSLVTKFCYKYMDDPNDRVSKHFFASGKIWNRTWDM